MKQFLRICAIVLVSVMTVNLIGCASTADNESTGQYFDSATITAKVKASILNSMGLTVASKIQVDTFKRVVQLSGFVSSQSKADQAIRIARGVAGVAAVENSIIVKANLQSNN